MKKILLAVFVVLLVGCVDEKPTKSNYKKVASGQLYDIYCIREVHYIVMEGGTSSSKSITPLLQTDGSISTCLDEESQIEYEEDLAFHEELSY